MAATKIQTQSILYTGNLDSTELRAMITNDLMLQKKQFKINPFGKGHVITVQTPSYSDLTKKLKKHVMPMCESDFSMRYIFDGNLNVPDFKNLLKWFRQNSPNKNVIVKSVKSSKVENNNNNGPEEVYVVFVNMIILLPMLCYGDRDKEIIEEAFTQVVFPWGSAISSKKVIRHQKKSKPEGDYTFNPRDYPSHPDINVFRRSSSVNYNCIDWNIGMKKTTIVAKDDSHKGRFLDSHQANFAKHIDSLLQWISKFLTKQDLTLNEILQKTMDDYLRSFKSDDDQFIYEKFIDIIIKLANYRDDHYEYGYSTKYSIAGFIDSFQSMIEKVSPYVMENSEHGSEDLNNLISDIEFIFKKQIVKIYDQIPDSYFPLEDNDEDEDYESEDDCSYYSEDDECSY